MSAPRPGSTGRAFGSARTRQRRALLKAGALAAASLSAAPAPAQGSGTKVLRYAFEQAEVGFDPAGLQDLYSRIITAHIYEGLYGYDHLARPYKIKPVTAVALPEVSDNFRRFLIRVKPGITFQDDPVFKGKPRELVAEDYVYSIKRFADPRLKAPAYAAVQELRIIGLHALREAVLKNKTPFDYDTPIEGMRALDRYTLEFRLERPTPRSLLQVLATPDLWGAVAREVIEAAGDKTMERPVGTGPFRLAAWTRSSRVVLERNPTYREVRYDAEPNADDAEGQALLARFKGQRLPMVDRWPEHLKSARTGKFMARGVAHSSAAPDGQPALYRGYGGHVGGQNRSRFRNEEFDRIFERISNLPDRSERLELFHQAKHIMLAYAPYKKQHVHRSLTDLVHPWVIGFRRAPYWHDWWQYVDVDMEAREKALQ